VQLNIAGRTPVIVNFAWNTTGLAYGNYSIRAYTEPVPSETDVSDNSLDNTLLYIQVEQAIFGLDNDDEYTVQTTNDKEEMKKLLSVGFEYVYPKDDMLFSRKRK